jgi:hypothetical protein
MSAPMQVAEPRGALAPWLADLRRRARLPGASCRYPPSPGNELGQHRARTGFAANMRRPASPVPERFLSHWPRKVAASVGRTNRTSLPKLTEAHGDAVAKNCVLF